MTTRDDLIRRLCEASEASAELSRDVREALGGTWSANEPCITTSLSAAWEEAERRGHRIISLALITYAAPHYTVVLDNLTTRKRMEAIGSQTHALALCAAMLAAEGER